MVWQTGGIQIARIGGISIEVHLTFALVIAWGGWQGWVQAGGLSGVVYGVLVVILLFMSVLLHELGHGLQARALGLRVRRITLLPIGGLAQLETPPSLPRHELMIALAGPMVNLGLSAALGAAALIVNPLAFDLSSPREWFYQFVLLPFLSPSLFGVLLYLLGTNVTLFVFNMIPAFPMDGGRILRAGLALFLDYGLATRLAAGLGALIAVAMGLLGVFGWPPARILPNPLLVVVALVVYYGARHEDIYVRRRRALVRLEAGDILRQNVEAVAPWDQITPRLAAHLFRHEHTLPVLRDSTLIGLLTYQDLRRHGRSDPAPTVAHVMRTHFPSMNPGDTLWVALQEMGAHQLSALPVIQDGVFRGMVSFEDIQHAWRLVARRSWRAESSLHSGDSPSI